MSFKAVISSGYTGRKLEKPKVALKSAARWHGRRSLLGKGGAHVTKGSCRLDGQNDSCFLLVQVQAGPCQSALFSWIFSMFLWSLHFGFLHMYFYFWCLIFGRLNEDLRKQWGLIWYKIDLTVLLNILNDRLTVECVRPLVHSPSLTKKNYPLTLMSNTL